MKVGYFINAYPKISHTFIRREIEALEKLGLEVARYSLRPNPEELVDELDKAEYARTKYILGAGPLVILMALLGHCLTNLPRLVSVIWFATRIGLGSDRGLLRHYAYVAEAALLCDWCRRDGIKHLHAHFGTNSATVAMLVAELANISFSFTAHGADEIDAARSRDMRAKLVRASFVVAVSWYVRSQLLRRLPFAQWSKIKVIHCGLGADFLKAPPPKLPQQAQFVCVGRLCDEKAQVLLVEAAHELRKQGLDFKVVLAGDGPLRGQIDAMIRENGLSDVVTVTGWISTGRVKEELSQARFLVLPSLIEGLPVAIMEAMAFGRPVISTYVAGIPELVENGESGWLVPAGDVASLVRAMAAAVSTPVAKIENMGMAGRMRVCANHDANIEAGKLAALFQPLLQ